MRITIRRKILAGFVLVILLILALSLHFTHISQISLRESVGKSSIFLAEEMLKRIDRSIYLKIETLQGIADTVSLREMLAESNRKFEEMENVEAFLLREEKRWTSVPKEQITPFMRDLIGNEMSEYLRRQIVRFFEGKYGYRVFGEVFLTNRFGANIAQTAKTTDYRQDDEAWWQNAGRSGLYVSDIEYDESLGEHGLTIGVRIDDEAGDILGVLKAFMSIRDVIREAEITTRKYDTTSVMVMTKNGSLIYRTIAFRFLEQWSHKNPFKMAQSETGFFTAEDGGIETLFSYAHSKGYREFGGLEWVLIVGHDVREVLKPAFVLRNTMTAFSLVLILLCVVISHLMSRSITVPLTKLSKSAEIIGHGDLQHRFEITSRDEIGDLGQVLNQMAERRQVAERELEQYRDKLERLVRERTRELEDAQEELVRKERLATLGRLTATVSHELRNPLGTISTSLYAVAQRTRGKDLGVEKALERARRNIGRCDEIIEELLDFTRMRVFQPEPTEVDSWLEEVLNEQIIPEGIVQVRHLAPGLTVDLDREPFRRCITNVVSNACQAMAGTENRASSENRLTVQSRRAGDRLEIRISDTGPGIRPEDMEKIFEPLFSTKSFGVGLGLPIVKQAVEKHGGGVDVESEPGKGTTMILWVPLRRDGERR